tara:strand:+ start:365 stop:1555 length:1191 start_codon:yes stop_codon:yes gene_type:complete
MNNYNLESTKFRFLNAMFEDGEIYIPEHQRAFNWPSKFKNDLIEDVIDGKFINLLQLCVHQNGKKSIEDGQQRFCTLRSFCKNEFKLNQHKSKKILEKHQQVFEEQAEEQKQNNKKVSHVWKQYTQDKNFRIKFSDLPEKLKWDIKNYGIHYTESVWDESEQARRFLRIQNANRLKYEDVLWTWGTTKEKMFCEDVRQMVVNLPNEGKFTNISKTANNNRELMALAIRCLTAAMVGVNTSSAHDKYLQSLENIQLDRQSEKYKKFLKNLSLTLSNLAILDDSEEKWESVLSLSQMRFLLAIGMFKAQEPEFKNLLNQITFKKYVETYFEIMKETKEITKQVKENPSVLQGEMIVRFKKLTPFNDLFVGQISSTKMEDVVNKMFKIILEQLTVNKAA